MGRDDLNESQDNVANKYPKEDVHTKDDEDKIMEPMIETKEKDNNRNEFVMRYKCRDRQKNFAHSKKI